MKTIKLPETFSPAEMSFLEEWYSEDGMQQLLSSNGKTATLTAKKSHVYGAIFVSVAGVPVRKMRRDNKTLRPALVSELKTIELLVSENWIK